MQQTASSPRLGGRTTPTRSCRPARQAGRSRAERPLVLICDLSGVDAIEPVCATIFATVANHPASRWPATSVLLCGAEPAVAEPLGRLRVPHFLPLYPTLQDALDAAPSDRGTCARNCGWNCAMRCCISRCATWARGCCTHPPMTSRAIAAAACRWWHGWPRSGEYTAIPPAAGWCGAPCRPCSGDDDGAWSGPWSAADRRASAGSRPARLTRWTAPGGRRRRRSTRWCPSQGARAGVALPGELGNRRDVWSGYGRTGSSGRRGGRPGGRAG
jgi:hypothetical protein